MKKILTLLTICVLSALILGACGAQTDGTEADQAAYKQIPAEEAVAMMEAEKDYIILDVRTAEEFGAGHIPGAVCVPNESIGEGDIPELPDKDQLILVYCRSGRRSKEAAQKLADLGYTAIVEFGGIIDWTGETVTES